MISRYFSEVIESFRLGREGQGSAALARVIDYLMLGVEQYATELTEDDILLLNEIIAAQVRGDYLFVADLFEYRIPVSTLGKIITSS